MRIKKGLRIVRVMLFFAIMSAIGGGIALLLLKPMRRPGGNELLAYTEKVYGKDFEIIEENSGQESFKVVEGSIYIHSILAGDISDRWLNETGPFCYDTPIEKYKAFLEELEQGQAVSKEELKNIGKSECMKYQIQMTMEQDVTLNEWFATFIAGEITARSYESEGEKYLSDYYEEYSQSSINEVYIMSHDLDGDGEDELLINVQKNVAEGKILIFHSQDGNLFEWESIPYGMHSPAIYLYDNIIEITGHGWSRSFFRYNSQGSRERVFDCYSVTDNQENGEFRRKYIIIAYEDGIETEELSITEIAYSDKENDWEVLESSEEVELFDRTLNDFLNMLGKGKQINLCQAMARLVFTELEENWEYLICPGEYEEVKLVNRNLIAVKDESGNYGIINREKDAITDFEYFNVWEDER